MVHEDLLGHRRKRDVVVNQELLLRGCDFAFFFLRSRDLIELQDARQQHFPKGEDVVGNHKVLLALLQTGFDSYLIALGHLSQTLKHHILCEEVIPSCQLVAL